MSDVLIIGCGLAGLSLALRLAEKTSVTLVSKDALLGGSTAWAQGGIASAMAPGDSPEFHASDTITASDYKANPETVAFVTSQAPEMIHWLASLGVEFTQENHNLHLTHEAGHTHRRVVHAADKTGLILSTVLIQAVETHPSIRCLAQHTAIDLIQEQGRIVGAYFLDNQSGEVVTEPAKITVLATGGASKAYLYCSTPDGCSGDGIAMASRAGAKIADMEFNQFHPTCLYHPSAKSFLISEAVRGEGGKLVLPDGNRFMINHDERLELAPRDIVARAIDAEMKRGGLDCVYLDITHQSAEFIQTRFPTIYQTCLSYGIDMTTQLIPVVPAAHYTCGGVVTNLQGQTNLLNLYAIGEVACTGLHGANRLASNSLLECLVFAHSASQAIIAELPRYKMPVRLPDWDASQVTKADEAMIVAHDWDELRRTMWDYVGIVRSNERLQLARRRLALIKQEVEDQYARHTINRDLVELRNLVLVSALMVEAASKRQKNCGLHYNLDLTHE